MRKFNQGFSKLSFKDKFKALININWVLGVEIMSDITETVAEQTKKGWEGFSKFMLISTTAVLAIVALMAIFLL